MVCVQHGLFFLVCLALIPLSVAQLVQRGHHIQRHHHHVGTLSDCPLPGEMKAMSDYPVLHAGPYNKDGLLPEYRPNITDDDGKTFTELFGPTSPVTLYAVRGKKLFQLGGDRSPIAHSMQILSEGILHAMQQHGSHSADFCFDGTDNDAFIKEHLRDTNLYCASQISWLPNSYPILAIPNDYYERNLLRKDEIRYVPWKDKISKVFWRGGLTGTLGAYQGDSQDEFFNLPRVVSYLQAKSNPDMWDFGFTHLDDQLLQRYMGGQRNAEQASFIDNFTTVGDADFKKELPRYKYLLNVDGIVVSWRLRELLKSGSVVLHFIGNSAEFFFRDLEPWVHYVPVHDLKEIPKLYKKLENEPLLAQRIAQAGMRFADERLDLDGQDCYFARFLEFVNNRTAYELADKSALKSMGFREIDTRKARAHFLGLVKNGVEDERW